MIDFISSFIFEGLIQNVLDGIFDRLVPATTPYRRAIYAAYMVVTVVGLIGLICVVAPIIVLMKLG